MAGGVRRVLSIGAIINDKDRFIYNRYVPGSGIGGNNIAVRRAKKIRAAPCKSNCLGPSTPQTPQQLTLQQ
jgi:hypothetical protein